MYRPQNPRDLLRKIAILTYFVTKKGFSIIDLFFMCDKLGHCQIFSMPSVITDTQLGS